MEPHEWIIVGLGFMIVFLAGISVIMAVSMRGAPRHHHFHRYSHPYSPDHSPIVSFPRRAMTDADDSQSPYHLVNHTTKKHLGPFSTRADAALASEISAYGDRWEVYDHPTFEKFLAERIDTDL